MTSVDDIILYMDIPKEFTKKLLEIINKFCKVIGWKITQNELHLKQQGNTRKKRIISFNCVSITLKTIEIT